MCHSDYHLTTGATPITLPALGGHEGAGVITKVGKNGSLTRVLDDLPAAVSADDTVGAGDIAFTGNHQFALTIGIGGSDEYRDGYGPEGSRLGTVLSGETA